MQADQDTLQQELDELVRSYLQRLPGKLESIQRIASSLHAATDTRKVLQELRTLVHRLSGSAGTYGCPDVGKAAREYENLIDIYLKFGIDSDSEDYEQLEQRLGKLEMTVTHTVKAAS